MKPQPIGNLCFANGKKRCVTAPMPFIVLQDEQFQYGPLALYHTDQSLQRRKIDDEKNIFKYHCRLSCGFVEWLRNAANHQLTERTRESCV
ncbi:hypothetical protein [Arsenophonus nasoniae]|uniref:hypothetical protein n=1 Tax=Arsenophonus nasoniae TaxID=638 RepID=UPI000900081D